MTIMLYAKHTNFKSFVQQCQYFATFLEFEPHYNNDNVNTVNSIDTQSLLITLRVSNFFGEAYKFFIGLPVLKLHCHVGRARSFLRGGGCNIYHSLEQYWMFWFQNIGCTISKWFYKNNTAILHLTSLWAFWVKLDDGSPSD